MADIKQTVPDCMVREYKIGNTKFIVKSRSRDGATEDAKAKIKRLIQNEVQENNQ